MEVKVRCWNCGAANLYDLARGDDPRCGGCKSKVLEAAYDGKRLPANAEPLPVEKRTAAKREPSFRCNVCGSGKEPIVDTEVSPLGWILFAICILSCFGILLCLVPLMIFRNPFYYCAKCGLKIGAVLH